MNKDHEMALDAIESQGGLIGEAIKTAKKGGYRPGAGRPRGSKNKLTKEARIREESVKERVLKSVEELVNAQLSLAKGSNFLYKIKMRNVGNRRKPEHILVTDPDEIRRFLDGETEDEYYYITTKSPDNKAIDSLLDRAFGKATTGSLQDNSFNLNLIQYGEKEKLGDGVRDVRAESDNDSLQLRSEELSAGVPESTSEIQDCSMAQTFGQDKNSSERTSQESTIS